MQATILLTPISPFRVNPKLPKDIGEVIAKGRPGKENKRFASARDLMTAQRDLMKQQVETYTEPQPD